MKALVIVMRRRNRQIEILVNVKVAKVCKDSDKIRLAYRHTDLQPFAIGVFHEFLQLMLGEVIRRSPEAVSDLNSDQAHADDMTKLGRFSNLLPDCLQGREFTPANTIHQSSHPTLLTSHIRVAKRKAMKISTKLRASIDVASNPPDLSALPIAGGVVGFCIFGTLNPRTQICRA